MPFFVMQHSNHIPNMYGKFFISDYLENIIDVFMDNFTIYGDRFDDCLINLEKVLQHCVELKLVLSYEKCHFMVDHGLILDHIVSAKGIKIYKG